MKKIILTVILLCSAYLVVSAEDFADNPQKRFEEFRKQRAFPFGNIPDGARQKAFKQMEMMVHEKNSASLMLAQQPEWKNIGPFNIGGRMKSVVIDPNNPDLAYAAAAAGGIWKTSDGGANWVPIFDYENSIAFGALAMDPNNSSVLYAGTGEAVNNTLAYLGSGLYKSTDAGNSWRLIGLSFVGAFSKVYVHPKNSNLLYAGGIKRGSGFYRSIDGGKTWEKTFSQPVTDVSINPNNENELLIGVQGAGIYYSSNGGTSWQKRNSNIASGIGRVSVQMAPSQPNIAYALVETNKNGYIYKTTNTGNYWGRIYTDEDGSFFRNQGFYNNYIIVHPTHPNVVFAGGIDIWRTINGSSFENMTNGYTGNAKMHVDQHCAAFYPKNPNILYVGNDGGMYKTTDLGSNWQKINNNLQVTQFYSMDIDDNTLNRNIAGAQDNGTQSNNTPNLWSIIVGGDGFHVAFETGSSDIMYGSSTPGGQIMPFRLNTKSGEFHYLKNGLNTADGVWDPPIEVHPSEPDIVLHGRTKFYISFSKGDYWTEFPTGYKPNGSYTAIGLSEAKEELIYLGTSDGHVLVTTNFGEDWEDVTDNGLVNRWVKDFACSYTKPGTAYVVYSGFGTPHVFKTMDFGKSWEPISSGLPDIPVNSIAIYPENEDMLFIGTDVGVFASFDGGMSWFPYGRKMARSPVTDIKFSRYITGDFYYLRAATHGRSIWEVQVNEEKITSPEINRPIGGEIYTATTPQRINWYGFKEPVKVELSLDDGLTWRNIANNVVGTSLLWNVPTTPSVNARIRVSSESEPTQIRTSNSFTIMQIMKGSILKQGGVNYVPYGIAWDGKDGLWSTSFYGDKIAKLNLYTFLKEKEFTIKGDSLFTDIAMDRSKGILYVHKIGSTTQGGGFVYTYDTTGKFIKKFDSPASKYPTGIEYVDGKLIIGDRDLKDEWDKNNFFVIDAETGIVEDKSENACQVTYGPRCLAYDQSQYVYQVCTNFPNGGALTEAYIQKIPKNNLTTEEDRIYLESLDGLINARGIDFDTRDKNIWITSFTGDIYKIAGFDVVVSVDDNSKNMLERNSIIESKIYPNPAAEFTTVSFKLEESGRLELALCDISGRKLATVYSKDIVASEPDYLQLNVADFAAGIYTLVFSLNGREIAMRKLMIVN